MAQLEEVIYNRKNEWIMQLLFIAICLIPT